MDWYVNDIFWDGRGDCGVKPVFYGGGDAIACKGRKEQINYYRV